MLPLLALAGGASAALGIGQGIATAMSNDDLQKRNKQKLADLLQREKQGDLGMTGTQKQLLDQQLMAPVASAASQARSRGEQIMAAGGTTSGADLSRLRTEQTRSVTQAGQQAALQIASADEAARQAQVNEIEQRQAAQAAMKRDDWNAILGQASQAAGTVGQLAGAEPGTFKLAGLFGSKLTKDELDVMSSLSDEEMGALIKKYLGGGA